MRRTPALVVLALVVALPALAVEPALGPFRAAAETDQHPPGTAAGVTYSAIQTPMVDPTGTFFFETQFQGGGLQNSGVFLGKRGAVQVVALAAAAAPDTGGRLWNKLIGVGGIVRTGGRVAFQGEIDDPDDTKDAGFWAGTVGDLHLVAREGDIAPGTTVVYASGGTYFQGGLHLAMNDVGQVAFRAKLAGTGVVNNVNDQALFAGAPGAIALVARLGAPAPAAGGATFVKAGSESFTAPSINASGKILFRGHLTGAGVTPTNADAFWFGDPGSLSIALRGTQAATGPGIPPGSTFITLGAEAPVLNDAGQILFESSVFDGLTLKQAVWLGPPGAFVPIAVAGQSAPNDSKSATFAGSFLHPCLNGSGQAAFHAFLSTGSNEWGVYVWDGAALRGLARSGDQAVGMPAGENYGAVVGEDLFLNGTGKVLFRTTTVPGLITGVWLGDAATGNVQLVARTGVNASVEGVTKQIIDLTLFSGPDTAGSPQDGRSSPLADDGTYAIQAQFLDGHIAVLTNAGAGGSPGATGGAYVVPTSVRAKANAKHPEKSTLTASGLLNTGADAPDFSGAATFDVGGFHLDVPAWIVKGRGRTFTANGITVTLTPAANGSSHATFTVKIVGDLTGKVDLGGALAFAFKNAAHDAKATATLAAGALAKHGVVAPTLSVLSASATLKGTGKDTLSITAQFATDGVVPAAPTDLTIGFGGGFSVTLPASAFVRKRDTYVLKAKTSGFTKATIDYAKGTATIAGAKLDLGAFADGAGPVVVTIAFGADARTSTIRMTKTKTKLAY